MIEPGKVLQQRYRIERQIGQGGMGAVYIATDERFGSIVAIKETLCMDDNYRKAIEREARLLNSLKHAALPRVSDHFVEDAGQFLVMEYIAGEDFGHVLENNSRPFSVEQVLTWADQLLDALDFLHNQVNPVIHRDIKPQNLKVTPKGQIILLDFGLAKGNVTDAGHHTAAKSIFGYSRNYASLEQIQGTGTDPRSDLYSLAATLYHLLTNTPPEDALTRAMAVLSRQRDPLVPANQIVEDIPSGVAYVLHRAMDLDAGQRPASAEVMRTMLREHEKYESQAATVVDRALAASASLHAQETRLMPGSTIGEPGRHTDGKTELLGAPLSHVTALRGEDTGSKKRRRSVWAVAALVVILVAGPLIGASYFYYPRFFDDERTAPEPQAVLPVSEQVIPETPQANASAVDDNSPTEIAANSGAPTAVAAANSSSKTEPGKPARNVTANPSEPSAPTGKITIDGDTVYLGDTKITDDKIETPDAVIDDNGVVRRTPPPPGVHRPPPVISPSDLRHLTPDQRRRVVRALRRSGITIAPRPSPTPQ